MTSSFHCPPLPEGSSTPFAASTTQTEQKQPPRIPENRTPNNTVRSKGNLKIWGDSMASYYCTQRPRQRDLGSLRAGPTWTQEGPRWEQGRAEEGSMYMRFLRNPQGRPRKRGKSLCLFICAVRPMLILTVLCDCWF